MALKTSSLKNLLNCSMKSLLIGFPGRIYSMVIFFWSHLFLKQ